jgi:hypothetical protein
MAKGTEDINKSKGSVVIKVKKINYSIKKAK